MIIVLSVLMLLLIRVGTAIGGYGLRRAASTPNKPFAERSLQTIPRVAALSPGAATALWSTVADHGSHGRRVRGRDRDRLSPNA